MTEALYTLTHESITVVWEGKPYTVQKGSPHFLGLRKAILDEKWEDVPNHLTVAKSVNAWANGKFKIEDNQATYDGVALQDSLSKRILSMVMSGEDPTPLFLFWERLQKNPSWRSVEQLWKFLEHQHIPLSEDGCFLAYKSVKSDYTDVHTGTISNAPGAVNVMPRNKISDDPNEACHYGFHVGALGYAQSFGGSRIVICKVDPEHVVCVPYADSQQKMRVCEYKVIGNYGSPLPSTTFHEDDMTPVPPRIVEADNDDDDDDDDEEGIDTEMVPEDADPRDQLDYNQDDPEVVSPKKDEENENIKPLKIPHRFKQIAKMETDDMLKQSLDDLRAFATHGLKIVGASKIPGGKVALVARIFDVLGSGEKDRDE